MMNKLCKKMVALALFGCLSTAYADNQTDTLSPVYWESDLPFTVKIERADFCLPNGLHSGSSAHHDGKWLFIGGRTNGMHGFENDTENFPPLAQNKVVYVVDPKHKKVYSRSLADEKSGLNRTEIDSLSVTSPQSYQWKKRLYITGGYGVDSSTGDFSTKDFLTAIDVPGLMHWVMHPNTDKRAVEFIRQIQDPVFQVTGGYMNRATENEPTLLIFGQNFDGFYFDHGTGTYTNEVRRFHIIDDGKTLRVSIFPPKPSEPDENYRRRDLNVVPAIRCTNWALRYGYIAYSGVFTPTTGIWTVPVTIKGSGSSHMKDPSDPDAFKQAMNNYICPTIGLFSRNTKDMYTIFPGGISFGYFDCGDFETDPEFPFINQVTTIRRDKDGIDTQYLMSAEYPVILSEQSNPGNRLLFGAGAFFMLAKGVKAYDNDVVKLDEITKEKVVGYIVGGIQSTLPNTTSQSDSAASPYIFKVTLIPRQG